ncbi:MAG TPA: HEPN domain-containing protein [Planctomycetota bacterium]|nr:HEPN domain-containing protein [Planctomycetota bacterium]
MDEVSRRHAAEWFERGRHSIETARLILEHHGHLEAVGYNIQQAIEMHLKGWLVLHGEKPPRVHELDVLLNLASRHAADLAPFLDLCERASRYYIETRYPPIRFALDAAAVETDLREAERLMERIERAVTP